MNVIGGGAFLLVDVDAEDEVSILIGWVAIDR